MPERVFICNQCHNLIKLAKHEDTVEIEQIFCSNCNSEKVTEYFVFTSKLSADEIGPPMWEFICRTCRTYFEVPSPKEPDETGTIRCAVCQGRDIERLNICSLENMEHTCFG